MNALRLVASSSRISTSMIGRRPLSTKSNEAVNKLRSVLEDYRQQHYTQEIPSRFKKEIVRAASQSPMMTATMRSSSTTQTSSSSTNSVVAMDGLRRVLINIGVQDRLEMAELQAIFREVGDGAGQIPAQRFYQIL